MRIPSGTTDQYCYFFGVDATDFTTPETGLSSFTVYRARNGAAAAAFTTPTVAEVDATNMAGVYSLLLDEDMTIDAGDDEQEMVFHISHAGMAPVVRTITLFRPKATVGETITVSSGKVTVPDTQKVDVHTIKTQTVTAATGVTFPTSVGTSTLVAGAQMDLVDDAITAAKFDESSAYPLKSADTGATAVARTGADSDTLETLSDQIDALPGAVAVNTFNDEAYNTVGYTLTTGTLTSGTSADTLTIGTPLIFAPTAAAVLDVDFEFELGSARVNGLAVTGYYAGAVAGGATTKYADVYLWDYLAATPAWVLITDGSNRIPHGTANVVRQYAIAPQYQHPTTGQVKVRYVSSRANEDDRLRIDQHFVNGIVTGYTLNEIANAVMSHRILPEAAQDGTHMRVMWYLYRQMGAIFDIDNVTGSDVTCSGDRFDSAANYVGHTLQFHLSGTNYYRFARVTAQTGAVLTVDAIQDVDATWHGYVLPERPITAAMVNAEADTALDDMEIETGVTLTQALQRIAAVIAGKTAGGGTGTETFVGMDGSTNRVTVTISSDNRTAVAYDQV